MDNKIAIFESENGNFTKQVEILEKHTNFVYCIVFSKKSNWFVSGSDDNSIICWK